ncbi:MAG TPA: cytochrome P450 [Terracidiphilus sp.]|nr:cytochrome P450 [Terracidiphilus sp.]
MIDIFSPEVRRNPFPVYAQIREQMPVILEPRTGAWMIFDYEGVKAALTDHQRFSSSMTHAGRTNPEWIIFMDPPRQPKLRALVSQAFTPKAVTDLEPRIRELSRGLLEKVAGVGSMDLVEEYAAPLPMMVIAEMIGIPPEEWARFRRWSDTILKLSQTLQGGAEAQSAVTEYMALKEEMHPYLTALMYGGMRGEGLLARLADANVDGEELTEREIIGFVELLIVAGQETTSNLIANAVLCLSEFPIQRARLKVYPELLGTAIEEVLRYRSPVQWLFRTTTQDVEMHEQTIPRGKLVIAVVGSANRDVEQFAEPETFDVGRNPNPHIAFGHGIHFCLGAALSRLEARVALPDLLERLGDFDVEEDHSWEPRAALHVHGPARLRVRFREKAGKRA